MDATEIGERAETNGVTEPAPVAAAAASTLPIGDVQSIIANAPSDCVEEILEVPEWGCSVRLRSLTARQAAEVKQVGIKLAQRGASLVHTEMEKAQFLHGVIEPKFNAQEVNVLFETAGGGGWSRVIAWLDEHSGTSEEERRKAAEAFPQG